MGYLDIVKLLIANNAEINSRDVWGNDAVYCGNRVEK